MQIKNIIVGLAVLFSGSRQSFAETLTFIAQPVSGGGFDHDWFSAANWFTTNSTGALVPVGRVPQVNDSAVIIGLVDAGVSGIRVQGLEETNGATVTGGDFSIENLQMLSGSSFSNSTVNILVTITASGTNCTLTGSSLSILGIATGSFAALGPPGASTFVLTQGSVLQVGGLLTLADGVQVNGGGLPTNTIAVGSGGVLEAVNSASLIGSSTGHLLFDNSGIVRADSGSVLFLGGIDWQCSGGLGEFDATTASASFTFSGPFQSPAGATNLFLGPGTSYLNAGGTVDGSAQVGGVDQATQLFTSGNAVVADSVSGLGSIEVTGGSAPGSILTWSNGTMSLLSLNIDTNGEMLLNGDIGTSRQLSGCVVNNSGFCTLLSGGLDFNQGAAISNLTSGTIQIEADGAFTGASFPAGGVIDNAGTLLKTSSGTTQFGATGSGQAPDFNNSGLVSIGSGHLDLAGGASSGTFQAASNSVLWFWGGTHTLNPGASFDGPGAVQLLQGLSAPTLLLTSLLAIPQLEVGTNGTLEGPGTATTNLIQVGTFITSNNGFITNGNFSAQSLQMLDSSTFAGSVVTVSNVLGVGGTNCGLKTTTLTVPATAQANFLPISAGTGATLSLSQGSVLQNGGSIGLADGCRIMGGGLPQSRLVLQPGAILTSTNSVIVQGATSGHLIVDHSGTVRASAGTLQFQGGIDWQCSSGSAEFIASDPGSLLLFGTPLQIPSGAVIRFMGGGTNRLAAGGMIDGSAQIGGVDPSTKVFVPGTLEVDDSLLGAGNLHVLAASAQPGVFSWAGGTVGLTAVNIDPNAQMLIIGGGGSALHLSGCVINNSGLCRWMTPLQVSAGAGSILNILAGGTLNFETDATVTLGAAGPRLLINNMGSLVKVGGTGTSTLMTDVNNSGTLEIKTGNLSFTGALIQSQGITLVDAGATLGAASFGLQGGNLSGAGTIAAPVVNSAMVTPGTSPGILTLALGENYQQSAAGTLLIELGGTTPGAQFDRLDVGGNASLNGRLQLSLINGFVPQPGQQFQILTCTSQTGSFSALDSISPTGTSWVVRYGATNVTLVVGSEVILAQPVLSGGVFHLTFDTTQGLIYVVQTSATLSPPTWQTLTTIVGDGTTKTVPDSALFRQRFYRVMIQ